MHRLTARLLLTFMLVGILAPVALAISTPAPHACCMRKPIHEHGSTRTELRTAASCNHDCCLALTVSQSAHLVPSTGSQIATFSTQLPVEQNITNWNRLIQSSHSGRAPPQFSIA